MAKGDNPDLHAHLIREPRQLPAEPFADAALRPAATDELRQSVFSDYRSAVGLVASFRAAELLYKVGPSVERFLSNSEPLVKQFRNTAAVTIREFAQSRYGSRNALDHNISSASKYAAHLANRLGMHIRTHSFALREYIDQKPTSISVTDRIRDLAEAVRNNSSEPIESLISAAFPELQAVQELRDQAKMPEIGPKPLFPGKRAGVDPVEFLLEHYGEEIGEGRIGPGYFHAHDKNLYMALRNQVTAHDTAKPENSRSLADFFDEHTKPEKRGGLVQRRLKALATVFATTEEETVKLVGNLRADRVDSIMGGKGQKGRVK